MSHDSRCERYIGCILFLLMLIIIASIIVGSIGAASYVSEKHDESVYKPTMCFVKNYTLVESKCSTQNCQSSGFGQQCTTDYYTCYLVMYTVIYNISDGTEFESTITATDGPGAQSVSMLIESEIMK